MIRISIVLCLCLGLFGCATVQQPQGPIAAGGVYHTVGSGQTLYRISKVYGVDMKEIMRVNGIQDPDRIGVGERLFIPRQDIPLAVVPYRQEAFRQGGPVEKLVGSKRYRVRWRSVTLHHSATTAGNAEAFDRNHHQRRMGGLAYHFVIGNGTASGDGEIEVGWRWTRQREASRKADIQVCLVGNFNKQEVSADQYASLLGLVKTLMKQYNIPVSRIRRHKDVAVKFTECPGDKFPYYKILADLRQAG